MSEPDKRERKTLKQRLRVWWYGEVELGDSYTIRIGRRQSVIQKAWAVLAFLRAALRHQMVIALAAAVVGAVVIAMLS